MAAQEYGSGAVYGSLAYDFDNPAIYGDEYAAPQDPAAKPKTKAAPRIRTRARAAARTRQSIAPLSIAGFLVAALLFTVSIAAQIELFAVSSESVELTEQLNTLNQDQDKLRIAYESAFNLSEIEAYATGTLGMQKPSADQILYIDTSAPDRAVVISDGGETFVKRVADYVAQIRAYFK